MNFIKANLLWIRLSVAILLLISAFYAGWKLNGWYNDSKNLAVLEQTEKLEQEFKTHEKNVATTLELKLKQLKANERVINNEKLKIVDRPVYNNTCLDIDGMSLVNKARGIEESDSSKSTD